MKKSVLLQLRAKKMKKEANYWNEKLSTEFTQLSFPKELSKNNGRWEKTRVFSLDNNRDNIKSVAVWALKILIINYMADLEKNMLFWIHENEDIKYPFLLKNDIDQSNNECLQEISREIDLGRKYAHYPTELLLNTPAQTVLKFSNELTTYENTDLTICISVKEKAAVKISANRGMYSESSIDLLLERFIGLLENLCPMDKAISEMKLYDKRDSEFYNELNCTGIKYDELSFIEAFLSNVKKYPEKVAFRDKNSEITFIELCRKSSNVAKKLISKNYEQQVIAVATDRTVDSMIAILGIIRSNNIYLPVDLSFPKYRIKQMLEISEAKLLVTDTEYKDKLNIPKVELSIFNSFEKPIEIELPCNFENAYIIFTSGTTGDPKAVLLHHRGLINRLKWMKEDLYCDKDTVFIQKTKRTFDVSIWELFLGLTTGNTTYLLENGQEGNPEVIINRIQENNITDIHFVPSMLSAFLDYLSITVPDKIQLKNIICSGEPLKRKHIEKCMEVLPNVEIINYYGPTEATIDVTCYHVTGDETVIPIGKPVANTKIVILDKENNPKPIGTIGELGIIGVQLAKCYKNNPQKTNISFVELSEGVRVYKTGDLARILPEDGGIIQYVGRLDNQVKIRGYRVEIEEIELYLSQCPGVTDSVVVVEKSSQGQENLVGYYKAIDRKVDSSRIRQYLSQYVPDYMIPSIICEVSEFPVTNNGKLDKEKLKRIRQEKVNRKKRTYTEDEKILCTIVEDVLGIRNLEVDQNFFLVGGNSINFVSILAKANSKGFAIEFQDIFAYPTVEKLVKISKANKPKEKVNLPPFSLISEEDKLKLPDDAVDAYPMTQLQSGLIYQCDIMNGDNNYHDIVTYTINGSIDIEIFKKCVQQLVEEQAIFRTTYNLEDYSENLQIVHSKADELPLSIFDLRSCRSESEKISLFEQWFKDEESKTFNWGRTELVKFYIHIMDDKQYKYSIGQHNSALDGWSLNKIHTFLFDKYYELKNGVKSEVKITDNSHNKHFIYLEKQAINSSKQKKYWMEKLKGSSYFEIPRSSREKKNDEVIFKDIQLPKDFSNRLISLANSWNVPVKSLLMSVTIVFLSILTGKKDIITGYELGGRPETINSEDSLGLYLNTVPFRIHVKDRVNWRELVQDVYDAESELLPYRRYPMAQIKQDLGNKGMLFDTVFNFTHFYSLKSLKKHSEFDLMNVRAAAVTEWPLRIEFSRHYYTDEIQFSLHYHTAEYVEDEIEFFGKIFVTLFKEMLENNLVISSYNYKSLDCKNFNIYPSKIQKNTKNISNETKVVSSDTVNELKKIWSEVLKIDLYKISEEDDFYELGGNSIAALRVFMKLDKKVALIEIIKNSKLIELAKYIDSIRKGKVNKDNKLIKLLSGQKNDKALIFVPYAAGNSGNFKKAADVMSEAVDGLSVYSVEIPGHDFGEKESLIKIDELTTKLVEEIKDDFINKKELYIWGHCVGAGLAVSLVEQLELLDINVDKLFIGSKLLHDISYLKKIIKEAKQISFDDIREIYSEFGDISIIEEEMIQNRIVKCFSHDSVQGNSYLIQALNRNLSLKTPLDLYVAKDDKHTSDYKNYWKNWKSIFITVNLKEIETGGHYYNLTNPEIFKDIIE